MTPRLSYVVWFWSCLVGAVGSADTPSVPVSSTADILKIARGHMVAILVDRIEDVPFETDGERRTRGSSGAEERNYFKRPTGYVSGLLLDDEGHVLTTHYNVAGKIKTIQVTSASGEVYTARYVSSSLPDDLALLKLEPREGHLPQAGAMRWGNSAELRPGQLVFVTGLSPEPASVTVTRGIVSATERNAGRALQTDAELNYGNVGGPILNLKGEVIGIAAFVGHTRPQWGVNSGIGFGTKAKTIHAVLPALKEGKEVRWALLGVRSGKDEPDEPGFRVEFVQPDSAADKAGLQRGDIILEFDDVALSNFGDLRNAIYRYVAHDRVTLKVKRKDKIFTIEVVLGERLLQ